MSANGPIGQPRGLWFGALIYIVTLGFYGLYWSFKTFEELSNRRKQGIGGVLGLVICFFISIVVCFIASSEVGKLYQEDGQEAPVTGWTGCWNFLPIIGTIVWWVKTQGALNRYWEAAAASPATPAMPETV